MRNPALQAHAPHLACCSRPCTSSSRSPLPLSPRVGLSVTHPCSCWCAFTTRSPQSPVRPSVLPLVHRVSSISCSTSMARWSTAAGADRLASQRGLLHLPSPSPRGYLVKTTCSAPTLHWRDFQCQRLFPQTNRSPAPPSSVRSSAPTSSYFTNQF